MTPAQKRVLDAIVRLTKEKGYAPSLEEIGKACGYSSLSTVHKHVKNLEDDGHLGRSDGGMRNLVATPNAWRDIGDVLRIRKIPPDLAAIIEQTMERAAQKERLDLHGEGRKAGRRKALLAILGGYQ